MRSKYMRNFSDATLEKKGVHIKTRYSPLKFTSTANNVLIDRKRTNKSRMRAIFGILWNKRSSNATQSIHGAYDITRNGRGRSYYDAYRLCMHYCPEVTFTDMWDELCKVIDKSQDAFIDRQEREYGERVDWARAQRPFWTCPDIGRARFCNEYKLIIT